MTIPQPSTEDTAMPNPIVYRVSEDFAAAYRENVAENAAVHAKVVAYKEAHPELPLYVWQSKYDHSVEILGFADDDRTRAVPPGLSRRLDRPYLIPRRGTAGDAWRKVMREHDAYRDLDKTVFRPRGLQVMRRMNFTLVVAGIYDYGEAGVFMRVSAPYEESEHLTQVKLSEFYAAQETHKAVAS